MAQLFRDKEFNQRFARWTGSQKTKQARQFVNLLDQFGTSAMFGEFIWDNDLTEIAKFFSREYFAANFPAIAKAFANAGTYESYLTVIRSAMGEATVIELETPHPAHLLINILNPTGQSYLQVNDSGVRKNLHPDQSNYPNTTFIAQRSTGDITSNETMKLIELLNVNGINIDVSFVQATKPVIFRHPVDYWTFEGGEYIFEILAGGGGGLTYQWYLGGNPTGENSNILRATADTEGEFEVYCEVTNIKGSARSLSATLHVEQGIEILEQPQSVAVGFNQPYSFSVIVKGSEPIHYQWFIGGLMMSEDAPTISLTSDEVAGLWDVYCVISNNSTSVTTDIVTLKISNDMSISLQPKDQTAMVGETATFSSNASNWDEVIDLVRWQEKSVGGDWIDIVGATAKEYTTPPVVESDNGKLFRAIFSRPLTSETAVSNSAELTVINPDWTYLVDKGGNDFNLGFVNGGVSGSTCEPIEWNLTKSDEKVYNLNWTTGEFTFDGTGRNKWQGADSIEVKIKGAETGEEIVINEAMQWQSVEGGFAGYKGSTGSQTMDVEALLTANQKVKYYLTPIKKAPDSFDYRWTTECAPKPPQTRDFKPSPNQPITGMNYAATSKFDPQTWFDGTDISQLAFDGDTDTIRFGATNDSKWGSDDVVKIVAYPSWDDSKKVEALLYWNGTHYEGTRENLKGWMSSAACSEILCTIYSDPTSESFTLKVGNSTDDPERYGYEWKVYGELTPEKRPDNSYIDQFWFEKGKSFVFYALVMEVKTTNDVNVEIKIDDLPPFDVTLKYIGWRKAYESEPINPEIAEQVHSYFVSKNGNYVNMTIKSKNTPTPSEKVYSYTAKHDVKTRDFAHSRDTTLSPNQPFDGINFADIFPFTPTEWVDGSDISQLSMDTETGVIRLGATDDRKWDGNNSVRMRTWSDTGDDQFVLDVNLNWQGTCYEGYGDVDKFLTDADGLQVRSTVYYIPNS
ncbi:TPA: immunoglobulin domain-containing protein [Vibrio harveyi]|nr:immunoglobulin domain-containing protein [Vibrio harveyi]